LGGDTSGAAPTVTSAVSKGNIPLCVRAILTKGYQVVERHFGFQDTTAANVTTPAVSFGNGKNINWLNYNFGEASAVSVFGVGANPLPLVGVVCLPCSTGLASLLWVIVSPLCGALLCLCPVFGTVFSALRSQPIAVSGIVDRLPNLSLVLMGSVICGMVSQFSFLVGCIMLGSPAILLLPVGSVICSGLGFYLFLVSSIMRSPPSQRARLTPFRVSVFTALVPVEFTQRLCLVALAACLGGAVLCICQRCASQVQRWECPVFGPLPLGNHVAVL
jgi:hypothetical protein